MDRIRLYLEMDADTDPAAALHTCAPADGLVVPAALGPDVLALSPTVTCVVTCCTEADVSPWAARDGDTRIASRGLDASARLRDHWSDVRWLPQAMVYRPAPRFDFRPADHGEGFKTYMPDLATYRSHRVAGEELDLRDWLQRAATLGFDAVWLHGADPGRTPARGLDLEMLARARARFPGELWISGDAGEPAHLENLAAEGGAHGVVVPMSLAHAWGVGALGTALQRPLPVVTIGAAGGAACAPRAGASGPA